MNKQHDIMVTLSTFGAQSDEPLRILEESGFSFLINPLGRRMKPAEVLQYGRQSRGLVAGVEIYDAKILGQMGDLVCISRCGVGTDSIDLEEAQRRGVAVLNTPDEPPIAVGEYTLAIMLALLRRLPEVNLLTRGRAWKRVAGNLLAGKTVGIVGLGRIGRRVAQLVKAFDAIVIASDPYPDKDWAGDNGVEFVDFHELLNRADIISVHASTSTAKPLRFGSDEMSLMKEGAWFINMGRGDIVDDEALCAALASGKLSGVGLDVFPAEPYTGPLCDNDKVILSPHQATLTSETRAAMETRAVENLVHFLRGERINDDSPD